MSATVANSAVAVSGDLEHVLGQVDRDRYSEHGRHADAYGTYQSIYRVTCGVV
jgi:hypothetical protein